jgi:hypothetical protein
VGVCLPVFIAEIAPVASGMALEELGRCLTGRLERFESPLRGDNLAEREFRS